MLQSTDLNIQTFPYEPVLLIDELSSTEIYIGTSQNTNNLSKANWRIKQIIKVGSVWNIGFPNGDQSYSFVWDDRFGYTYSA